MRHRAARTALLAGALALLVVPAPAPAQAQGEVVDVQAAAFPPLVLAGAPFHINVTVQNKDTQAQHVFLFATLYTGTSSTPCEGVRANHTLSKFRKSVTLQPGERTTVEGAREHWAQVVNGSLLEADGAYEVCVWAQRASCPGCTPEQYFLDHHPTRLQVRLRNAAPQVEVRAEPERGTTATRFLFAAQGGDPDGDPVGYTWAFGDGAGAEGPRVGHRFARPGTYTVQVTAHDGFNATTAERTVEVAAAGGGAGEARTPGPGALAAVLALLAAGLTPRRAGSRASPAPR